jgi:deazaflavin-dependent oxidoreductase (nitroreductase family)
LPNHPAWYRNLVALPDVLLEVGSEIFEATASVLKGDARARIWSRFVADIPQLPGWQRDAGREFPIIAFTRKT